MSLFRDRFHAAGASGLTRREVLFFLGVLGVLAVLSAYPLHLYLERKRLETAVENAKTLSLLLSQYAEANNGVYPTGEGTNAQGKSEGIALNFLQNEFTPNTDIFTVGATPGYSGTAKDYSDLKPENVSWDFTAGANATTGIKSDAPDLLPVVYTTGETVTYPAPGKGLDLPISGRGPFGTRGMVVGYKGGNALFIKAGSSGSCPGFISPDFKDTGTYTQIRP